MYYTFWQHRIRGKGRPLYLIKLFYIGERPLDKYCFLQGHAGIQRGGELKAVCLQLLTCEKIWGSKRSASAKGFKNRLPYTVRNTLIMTAIYQKKNPKPKPSDDLGYGRSAKGKHWYLFAISYCSFCLAIFFYCQSIPTKKKTLFHGIINN